MSSHILNCLFYWLEILPEASQFPKITIKAWYICSGVVHFSLWGQSFRELEATWSKKIYQLARTYSLLSQTSSILCGFYSLNFPFCYTIAIQKLWRFQVLATSKQLFPLVPPKPSNAPLWLRSIETWGLTGWFSGSVFSFSQRPNPHFTDTYARANSVLLCPRAALPVLRTRRVKAATTAQPFLRSVHF